MRLAATVCLMLITLVHAAWANGPQLARAMAEMRAGNWDAARTTAAAAGPVARDVIEWHRLRSGRGTFPETQAFLERRGDWPGLPYLRKQSEDTIRDGQSGIVEFFADTPPQTGLGALRHAIALGSGAAAEATLVRAWRTMEMSAAEEVAILASHARLLARHHEARLDMLLWAGETTAAKRLLPRVSDGWKKLATARMTLRDDGQGVGVDRGCTGQLGG